MSSGVLNAPAGVLEICPAADGDAEPLCRVVTEETLATLDEDSEFEL
jgi:hypothetical protein